LIPKYQRKATLPYALGIRKNYSSLFGFWQFTLCITYDNDINLLINFKVKIPVEVRDTELSNPVLLED
jgi:hypothetical protein